MKRIFYTAGTLLLLIFLLRFPEEALAASRDGLKLWLNTLFPTLLPFIILTGILIHTGTAEKLLKPLAPVWSHVFGTSPSGAYALLLGLLCGYNIVLPPRLYSICCSSTISAATTPWLSRQGCIFSGCLQGFPWGNVHS